MREIVDEGISVLSSHSPITDFGELLDESWQYKRRLSDKVSNAKIDQLYAAAKDANAIGGKVLGAGGGGFLLLFAKPEYHDKIKAKLNQLVFVDFDYDEQGTQVVYKSPLPEPKPLELAENTSPS